MLIEKLEVPLLQQIALAVDSCSDLFEEEGGIILKKEDEYKFVKLLNTRKGTGYAAGLYEVCDKDLAEKVFPLVRLGWQFYASFHTHPSHSATPSQIDMVHLFESFKVNVIYSVSAKEVSFCEWEDDQTYLSYFPFRTLNKVIQNYERKK